MIWNGAENRVKDDFGAVQNMAWRSLAFQSKKTAANGAGFMKKLTGAEKTSDNGRVEAYQRHLEQKYGNVTIQSVGRDSESLEKIGKSMSGNDVVIAPNILEEMANEPEKAAYYEQKIDYFFQTIIPRESALCAARGLVFEPCGVVVHEDGTVTYICGCSDSPERVAEVNAINKAKREKKAALQKEYQRRSMEAAERRQQEMELLCQQRSMAVFMASHAFGMGGNADLGMFQNVGAGSADYERNMMPGQNTKSILHIKPPECS